MATAFTMVMRCGTKETPVDEMLYNLISSEYQVVTMAGTQLKEMIASKRINVLNMDVTNGKLVSTNGALDNYPLYDPMNRKFLVRRAVILERIEIDSVLKGYMVYTADGILRKLTVKDTLALEGTCKIANGKIYHTSSGDIISSIAGSYPIAKLSTQKRVDAAKDETQEEKSKLAIKLFFTSVAIGRSDKELKYAGVMVECNDAIELAKAYEGLTKNNESVIKAISIVSDGKAKEESLKMTVTGGNSFYGVYEIGTVMKLLQSYGQLDFAFENLQITCMDYSGNLEDESYIAVDKKLSAICKEFTNQRATKALREFSEEVLRALNKVRK